MKGITSLDFLRAVYANVDLPLSVRMRAASMAIPFEFPRLAVTAFIPEGGDFAQQLDRRLKRRRELKLIEATAIEAKPINGDEGLKQHSPDELKAPEPVPDRRFRKRV